MAGAVRQAITRAMEKIDSRLAEIDKAGCAERGFEWWGDMPIAVGGASPDRLAELRNDLESERAELAAALEHPAFYRFW